MTNKDDLVVGFITGYNFEKLKPWVYSLIDSGFEGQKMMICYNIEQEVLDKLQSLGFFVINVGINEQFNVVNIRFLHIWQLIKQVQKKFRYVISTDVADVIFQTNPSEWMEKNLGDKKLCVGSEGLKYKDEDWGNYNMYQSFGPLVHDYMLDKTIYNAGTIAGDYETFLDFCHAIYLSFQGSPAFVPGGGGPDQAALNVLLSLKPYRDITKFNTSDDGWACQCGTMVDLNKIEKFRPNLLDNEPFFKDGVVYTSRGNKFCLVHQYNRVPQWNQFFLDKYKDR
jgi:hypothetical protein